MDEGAGQLALQLLGPVRAHAGSRELPLGGVKARGVLALLALRAPHTVSLPELAEALWAHDPPPSAVPTLQAYLSRLRATLGAEVVPGGRTGYLLDVDPQAVDVHRFRDLLTRARRAGADDRGAAELAEAALSQWHGRALADLDALPWAPAAATQLEGERLAALQLLFELRLRLGQHALVLSRLQTLSSEHPLDELLARQLMLALYRSGRQPQALEVYARLRAELVREVGVEPTLETRTLHEAVLRQDASLSAPDVAGGPGNLPSERPSFVGRRRERDELARRLRDDRLVPLVGRSGIGKTRLAMEVADALDPADGAWLVDLGATVHAEAVLPALAAALGVRDQPGVDAHAALVAALRPLDAVLVADGCDSVLPTVTQVLTGLVAACPRLRALTTSVHAPDAPAPAPAAVAPYELGPLPLPGEPDAVAGEDAVALLLARARDAAGAGDDDPLALARLVRAAGGVPLDVELVAARLRTTTAAELAASLDQHEGAVLPWTLAARHPDERRLLRRLAAFPAAFGHAAATVVAAGEVDELLAALARSSLVATESAAPQRRFRLPDAVRAEVGPAPDDAAVRHAGAFLELAERAGDRLRGHASAPWFARLDLEQASLRAALHWTVRHAPADAVRLVSVLGWYWFRRGRIAEGRGFVDAALAAAADRAGLARSGAHLSAAALAYHAGDLPALGAHTRDGLADAGDRGEGGRDVVRLLLLAVWHAALSGAPERCAALTEQALVLAAGDPEVLGEALLTRGMLERLTGRLETAAETLEQARAVAVTAGNSWAAGSASWIAAKVALDRGQPAQAHGSFAESLRQAVVDDDVASGLVNLLGIAGLAALTGDPERGARLLGAVAALGERIGYDPVRMDPLDGPRAVEAVRSALSDADFRAAFARGRQASFPDATALGYAGLRPA